MTIASRPLARAALVRGCADVIAENGLRGTSLGALARSLGRSKSGLLTHFRSKEDLEVAVVDELSARFQLYLADACFGLSGVARLSRLLHATAVALGRTGAETCVLAVAVREIDGASPRVFARLRAVLFQWRSLVIEAAEEACAAQRRPSLSEHEAARFACVGFGVCVACGILSRIAPEIAGAPASASTEIDDLLDRHGFVAAG